jgi:hypothetical protein
MLHVALSPDHHKVMSDIVSAKISKSAVQISIAPLNIAANNLNAFSIQPKLMRYPQTKDSMRSQLMPDLSGHPNPHSLSLYSPNPHSLSLYSPNPHSLSLYSPNPHNLSLYSPNPHSLIPTHQITFRLPAAVVLVHQASHKHQVTCCGF